MPATAAGERLDVRQAPRRVVVGNNRRRRLGRVERQKLADDRRVWLCGHCHVVVVDAYVCSSCVHPRHLVLRSLLKFAVASAQRHANIT